MQTKMLLKRIGQNNHISHLLFELNILLYERYLGEILVYSATLFRSDHSQLYTNFVICG
jgi:hypothetical protein